MHYMAKERTTVSIEGELLKEAKEQKINVSQLIEKAIKEKINGKIDQAQEERECKECGKIGLKEYVWLIPGEYWICKKCLNKNVKKVVIGTAR